MLRTPFDEAFENLVDEAEIRGRLNAAVARLRENSAMLQLRAAVAKAAAEHAAEIGRPNMAVRYFKAGFLGIRGMLAAIAAGLVKVWRMENPRRGGALWLEIISQEPEYDA